MAAIVRIVPENDWNVISKYLDDDGSIWIPEQVAKELESQGCAVQGKLVNADLDGQLVEYDFGGDPDQWIDVVHDGVHLCLEEDE